MTDSLNGLQLDIAGTILRLEQIQQECEANPGDAPDGLALCLLERVFTCDVPRLYKYLGPEALALMEQVR